MPSAAISVEINQLQLRRGHQRLFAQSISERFCSGVLNLLTGPNGSGKTTLLDVISYRAPTPSGAGVHWSTRIEATDIAYLPQQLWDVLDIRIADLLALAIGFGCPRTIEQPALLQNVLARRSKELAALSGGQRQLLLFWLVSSQQRRIFIYDEPVRYLDPISGRYVMEMIENQVNKGMFVVVTDHSQETQWRVPCHCVALVHPVIDGR